MIGQTFSHFRIRQKVGAGGMGVVYRARDERLDRDVALKVLPAGLLADEAARKRFRKEALALSKLNHPNIATVHDFDTQDGVDFVVMEYIAGETLAQLLKSGGLPEKEVTKIGAQIAAALEEAHERGIVHRDLKPGNIMLTPKGQVKILDFGLAKMLEAGAEPATASTLTETRGPAGTLPYMSPEQLGGEPVDARSDIWAAGAVVYEMATGQRAFPEGQSSRLIDAILNRDPQPPRALNPRISPELERVLLKCLEKDPENRYQSAKELLVDLRRLSGAAPRVKDLPRRRLRLRPAAAGLLVVALLAGTYLARQRYWPWTKPPTEKIRLVVLPFDNLSRDPEQEYFSDGLTEEMIAQLGRLEPNRLGVIARTSAMQYKGTKKRIDEIGRELGVNYVLEGSVRREGGHVRINAELIQVRDQTPLWTETYERDLAGIFALQTEVAGRIASSLALELIPSRQAELSHAQTTNPAAHEAYLRGRHYWGKATEEGRRKAKEYFEQAIRMDPNYAPAYAGLADYYRATTELPPPVGMPKAGEYALKALKLDNTLAEAHTTLAAIRFFGEWDWSGAEKEWHRALELNPNDAEAQRAYSVYLSAMGRAEEALAKIRRALELDPLSPLINGTAGWAFYFARQYDKAIEQCGRTLELDPNSVGGHECLGAGYLAKGMYEQAIAESQQAVDLSRGDPARVVTLAWAYAAAGRKAEADKLLGDLHARARRTYVSPYFLAIVHVTLGQNDEALAALEKAYAGREPALVWLKVQEAFDPLREEARFKDLLRRIGLPP